MTDPEKRRTSAGGPRPRGPRDAFGEHPRARAFVARLRLFTRRGELWLTLLGGVIGLVAGLSVLALHGAAQLLHVLLFKLPPGQGLSAASVWRLPDILIPAAGGILLGVLIYRLPARKSRIVDPVEANALHGGRMSLTDSLIIAAQTLLSNGFGASVGLEAAYTQLGSGFASKLGAALRLRRADVRMLVGAGAAGAIAAAFDAPLTGAFYAFELIIGTYTLTSLAPVMTAAVVAVLLVRGSSLGHTAIFVPVVHELGVMQVGSLAVLALATGVLGIFVMYLVTRVESLFKRFRAPAYVRPAVGGLLVGLAAIVNPIALSSGHAAVQELFSLGALPVRTAALLLGLKVLASSLSIGSGFRGGLFFASLLLGALTGQVFYGLGMHFDPGAMAPPEVATLVGMTGLAAAIVGGPLTMAFLGLEVSGSLPLTIAVLVAAVGSSLLVRQTFGYSFTTWRFHLRGEAIRSAVDIGRLRTLTVGRMMRKDVRSVAADTGVREFRRAFPLGSTQRVVAVEPAGEYAGIVLVPELYSTTDAQTEGTIRSLLAFRDTVLTPEMSAKEAALLFERSASEALAVVVGASDRRVIGLLTEAHVLRRYAEELDKARMDLAGERA